MFVCPVPAPPPPRPAGREFAIVRVVVALVMLLLATVVPAAATDPVSLPEPTAPPLLVVDGAIDIANRDGAAVFDRPMLESLGLRTLRTSTTWTDGTVLFEGVLMRDVLRAAGARGETVEAAAINDYRIRIPITDFETYDVLIALRMNGKDLSLRDKGPLWIVYPRDDHSELKNGRRDHRWVWQLNRLRVR